MKVCCKCKVSKDPDQFNKNKSKSDGLQSACRNCANAATRKTSIIESIPAPIILPDIVKDKYQLYRENFNKICTRCKKEKTKDQFGVDKGTKDKKQTNCKQCLSEKGIFQQYNISLEKYNELLSHQKYVCAICENPVNSGGSNKITIPLNVDHDHTCCQESGKSCGKCIRGLLCDACNKALGFFNDNPIICKKAAEYIIDHRLRIKNII